MRLQGAAPFGGIPIVLCHDWATTLQVAELWAEVHGLRLAAHTHPQVCVGSDGSAAHFQVPGLGCSVSCVASPGLLCALFWVRQWTHIEIAGFYVHTKMRPADPPSRQPSFCELLRLIFVGSRPL